ncbi:MAG: hypothetical protein ABFE08_05570 [Armatimonadia bacterium]
MTWPDYVTIGLCIALGIVESKRGFVPAFFAMIGVIITIEIAAATYTNLVSSSLSYASAYIICVLIGVAIVAGLTTLIIRYAPTDIGSFDSSLGGLMGIITGLVLSHAMYGAVILAYGSKLAPVYANSALAGQVYELRAFHGFMDFISRIGTTDIAK